MAKQSQIARLKDLNWFRMTTLFVCCWSKPKFPSMWRLVWRRTTTVMFCPARNRSEEHTSELQSLMRISYAVFCLKKKKTLKDNYSVDTSNNMQYSLQLLVTDS